MKTESYLIGKPAEYARRSESAYTLDMTTLNATTGSIDTVGFEQISFHFIKTGSGTLPTGVMVSVAYSPDGLEWIGRGVGEFEPVTDGLFTFSTLGFPYMALFVETEGASSNPAAPVAVFLTSKKGTVPNEPMPSGLLKGGNTYKPTGNTDIVCDEGIGVILNAHHNPNLPWGQVVIFEQQTISAPVFPLGVTSALVLIDENGDLITDTDIDNYPLLRTSIVLGVAAINPSTGIVSTVTARPFVSGDLSQLTYDFLSPVNSRQGVVMIPSSIAPGALSVENTKGHILGVGLSWQTDRSDPNRAKILQADPMSFWYLYSDGSLVGSSYTAFIPNLYETSAGKVLVVVTPGSATITRVFLKLDGTFFALFGQYEYASVDDAVKRLAEDEAKTIYPEWLTRIAVFVGYAIMIDSAIDFSDDTLARLVDGHHGPFGWTGNGGN